MSLREFADQGKERQIHGDDDGTDCHAEEAYEKGFDQREQVGYCRVHFLLVEVCNLGEHRVERAGLFTDSNHLRDHVREDFRRLKWIGKVLASLNPRTHLHDRLLDNHVARSPRCDVKRLKNRHAG